MPFPLLNEYVDSSITYQLSYNVNSLGTAEERVGVIVICLISLSVQLHSSEASYLMLHVHSLSTLIKVSTKISLQLPSCKYAKSESETTDTLLVRRTMSGWLGNNTRTIEPSKWRIPLRFFFPLTSWEDEIFCFMKPVGGMEAETPSVIAAAEQKAAEPPRRDYNKSENPHRRALQ